MRLRTLSILVGVMMCSLAHGQCDLPEAVTGVNVDVAETGPIPSGFEWLSGPESVCADDSLDSSNAGCAATGEAFVLAEDPSDLVNFPFSWGGQSGTFLVDDGADGQAAARDYDAFFLDLVGLGYTGASIRLSVASEFEMQVLLLDSSCGTVQRFGVPGNCVATPVSIEAVIDASANGDGQFYLVFAPLASEGVPCGADYRVDFISLAELVRPANARCISATSIDPGDLVMGSTFGTGPATRYNNCGSDVGSFGVWYKVRVSGNDRSLIASTCESFGGFASFDSRISVYCGSCYAWACRGQNDDDPDGCGPGGTPTGSTLGFDAKVGVTYFILVHGDQAGTFTLSLTDAGSADAPDCTLQFPPLGCIDAIQLGIGDSVMGNTAQIGVAPPFPAIADCMPSDQFPGVIVAPTLWYSVAGNGNYLDVSTCGTASFDTAISVYCNGCEPSRQICYVANDDGTDLNGAPCPGFTSRVILPSAAGETYVIAVHGWAAGSVGTFTLTISDTGECNPEGSCLFGRLTTSCNPVDINDANAPNPSFPDFGIPDGIVSPTDFAAFALYYQTGDLRADFNDANAPNSSSPDFGIPDGLLTPTDFSAFVEYYAEGCPCTTLPGCPFTCP